MIEAARSDSLNYGRQLPDFICVEAIKRLTLTGRFVRSSDNLRIQVTYFGQKEKYKLLSVNGTGTDQPFESLSGLVSGGEFGTMLFRIFDPASAAQLEWKSWSKIGKRPAAVYNYRVAVGNSHHEVGYRMASGEIRAAIVGYRGEVVVDRQTNRVLRLTLEASDIPKDFDILRSVTTVSYAFVDVAGGKHLLPVEASSEMARPRETVQNDVTFKDYRKFSADSSVDFK